MSDAGGTGGTGRTGGAAADGADGAPPPRLSQVAVTKHDLARAVAWYRDVLGLPLLFEVPPGPGQGGMAFFDLGGGVRFMLTPPEAAEFDHPASVLYFAVTGLEAREAEVRSRGATIERSAQKVADLGSKQLWMAFLRDPEGHLVALTEER